MVSAQSDTILPLLFPEAVITEETTTELLSGELYPEEAASVIAAAPKRIAEFTAGRLCARRALEKLGIRNFPLIQGQDRAPIWPPGVVGSISHTKGFCGVAVASKSEINSLGLDIERTNQASPDIWPRICTAEELSWVRAHPSSRQQALATLIFSAKECFYKCQYYISRQWVGFQDVELSINLEAGRFHARLLIDISQFLSNHQPLEGKFLFRPDYVFTGMALPP